MLVTRSIDVSPANLCRALINASVTSSAPYTTLVDIADLVTLVASVRTKRAFTYRPRRVKRSSSLNYPVGSYRIHCRKGAVPVARHWGAPNIAFARVMLRFAVRDRGRSAYSVAQFLVQSVQRCAQFVMPTPQYDEVPPH